MHEIHHTDAFVLECMIQREYDAGLTLFTKEFGVIFVYATGLFRAHSKLRAHVQLYAYTRISIVRGRNFWRLVGAEVKHNPSISPTGIYVKQYVQFLHALTRFYTEEEPSVVLFEHTKRLLEYQINPPDLSPSTVMSHALFVLFYTLGYIEHKEHDELFLEGVYCEEHEPSLHERVRYALKMVY